MILNLNRGVFGPHSVVCEPASALDLLCPAPGVFEMLITASCTLTLLRPVGRADLCLVAGGKPGGSAQQNGGLGGAGGEVKDDLRDLQLPAGDYAVTVGGSGEDTVIVAPDGRTWTAVSGSGSDGGVGGHRAGYAGKLAWDDADTLHNAGYLYGPGGGMGSYLNNASIMGSEGAGGDVGTAADSPNNHGRGGVAGHANGYPGLDGLGQGGGGARYTYNGGSGSAGSGGTGAVLLRSHKEVSA